MKMKNCGNTCSTCGRFSPEGNPSVWGDRKNLCEVYYYDQGARTIQDPENNLCDIDMWQGKEEAISQRQLEQEEGKRLRQDYVRNSYVIGDVLHIPGRSCVPEGYTGKVAIGPLFFDVEDGEFLDENVFMELVALCQKENITKYLE